MKSRTTSGRSRLVTGEALDAPAPAARSGPVYGARRVRVLVDDDTAACCSERGETTFGPASARTVTRATNPMLAACTGRVQLSRTDAAQPRRIFREPKRVRAERRGSPPRARREKLALQPSAPLRSGRRGRGQLFRSLSSSLKSWP